MIVIGLKLLIGFYCYQLILTYITQDIGAARTLFPMNILFVIGLLGLFFWLNRYLKSITIPPFLPVVLNGLSVISIVLLTYQQIRQTNHYSTQLEKRNEHLMTNNSIPHLLEPLPPSGYLYSSEISADSNHYSNQHLKLYFELKYAPIITTQQ